MIKLLRRWVSFSLLLLVLSLLGLGSGQRVFGHGAVMQESANLLGNPGFEGEYYPWFGISEVQVAHGWTPWWRTRTDADPPTYYFKPEYKQANGYVFPNRVHGGAAAQQWFTFHATHQAGMYQQVSNVTPGARYRFTAWAQVWSSSQDNPDRSTDPAYPNLQVGIDPTGNWDPWAGSVVWSGPHAFFDSWGQLGVEAVAQNSVITVFLRSDPNFPVKHNDMYWDDAALVVVGQGGTPIPPTATPVVAPPSTATPAGPPLPTPTSAGPPSPTPTCAPAPNDWVTYLVRRGDTLYALAKSTGTTLDMIMAVNCLRSTTIFVGQGLLLPQLPATASPAATSTPSEPTRTIAPATGTATVRPTTTATAAVTATRIPPTATDTPSASATALPPTAASATETPVSIAAATATSGEPSPTASTPPTPTARSSAPLSTATPAGGSTRPCGTIVVGAGIVLLAGGFRYRRKLKRT